MLHYRARRQLALGLPYLPVMASKNSVFRSRLPARLVSLSLHRYDSVTVFLKTCRKAAALFAHRWTGPWPMAAGPIRAFSTCLIIRSAASLGTPTISRGFRSQVHLHPAFRSLGSVFSIAMISVTC